ncbi:hypothetical protein XU18_4176 [Perkinsela sp. CCAP 1560/4]|nr:hypothetical protein XU18_4176 [Perkinsela sp. CCAP 1560/4]|eukprot:KNH04636.1 hypothetical protein XU18_4176 [Perkinsela sp. CCAP 1560/4]
MVDLLFALFIWANLIPRIENKQRIRRCLPSSRHQGDSSPWKSCVGFPNLPNGWVLVLTHHAEVTFRRFRCKIVHVEIEAMYQHRKLIEIERTAQAMFVCLKRNFRVARASSRADITTAPERGKRPESTLFLLLQQYEEACVNTRCDQQKQQQQNHVDKAHRDIKRLVSTPVHQASEHLLVKSSACQLYGTTTIAVSFRTIAALQC